MAAPTTWAPSRRKHNDSPTTTAASNRTNSGQICEDGESSDVVSEEDGEGGMSAGDGNGIAKRGAMTSTGTGDGDAGVVKNARPSKAAHIRVSTAELFCCKHRAVFVIPVIISNRSVARPARAELRA